MHLCYASPLFRHNPLITLFTSKLFARFTKQALQKRIFQESIDQLNAVKTKYGMLYGEDYMLMSYCYKEMGNDSLAAIYVKQACSVPSFDMRVQWYIKDLNPGYISEGFNEQNMKLKDEGFEISWKNYQAKNADSLIAVIDSMTYWDQFYRNQCHINPDNKQFQDQLDSMNRVNEKLLEEMVRRIGFPERKEIATRRVLHFGTYWFIVLEMRSFING